MGKYGNSSFESCSELIVECMVRLKLEIHIHIVKSIQRLLFANSILNKPTCSQRKTNCTFSDVPLALSCTCFPPIYIRFTIYLTWVGLSQMKDSTNRKFGPFSSAFSVLGFLPYFLIYYKFFLANSPPIPLLLSEKMQFFFSGFYPAVQFHLVSRSLLQLSHLTVNTY